jgi:hypothetical protein
VAISLEATIIPRAFLPEANPALRPITGRFSMQATDGKVYRNGEEVTAPADIVADLMETYQMNNTIITISSDKTGANETTVTVELENDAGDTQTTTIVVMLDHAPDFKEIPDAATIVLNETYATLYRELLAAVKKTDYIGSFFFVTENDCVLTFSYYGFEDPTFYVSNISDVGMYSHQITKVEGEYVVNELPDDNEGEPNFPIPDVSFPVEATWTLYMVTGYNEEAGDFELDDGRELGNAIDQLLKILDQCTWQESDLSQYDDADFLFYIDNWETFPYEVAYDADSNMLMLWMLDLEVYLDADQAAALNALIESLLTAE